MNLVFFTYNNYYNRIVKKFNTIAEYEEAVPASNQQEYYDIQFNPNDGINTEQVVNWGNNNWTPDYLVVYDDTLAANINIQSRWFVIEWVRTRGGQYKATLHRDVIADNYDTVTNAPMFIEKATVPFTTDPAIYNKEDMFTNEIKSDQIELKDSTSSAWLVGYYAKNINWGTGSGQIDPNITIPAVDYPAIHTNTLSGWDWYTYTTTDFKYALAVDVKLHISLYPQAGVNNEGTVSTNGEVRVFNGTQFRAATLTNLVTGHDNRVAYLRDNILPQWQATGAREYVMQQSGYSISNIMELNDSYLFVETGADAGYYHIKVVDKGAASDTGFYAHDSVEEQYLASQISDSKYTYPDVAIDNQPVVQRDITYEKYRIELTKVTPVQTTFDWPALAKTLSDAPYGMFAMPYNEVFVQKSGTPAAFYTLEGPDALNIVCTLAERLGSFCYDIQLLPYCPMIDDIKTTTSGTINITKLTENQDYAFVKDGSNNLRSIVFFAKRSSFSLNIQKSLTIPRNILDDHEDTEVEDYKICNQCDKYRLRSPNGSASFDFNLVKTGVIKDFQVDCTYKPFSPYIRIQPLWGNLYGGNYQDYRGLVCQGDFSIPMINDAWTQYMINNKNYLNSFNRQIDSIELNNQVQHKMDVVNAIAGTAQGGMTGAMAGAKFGPYGAIAGAAVGTIASGAAGAMDVRYNQMLRNDALDLTIDQFGYNLQNIQARPDTLAKVSSYDKNNTIWPVLEYYTCTYEEKLALLNKMKYNGMTIMRIGTINAFYNEAQQYIKGKLIRDEVIVDDFHVLTAIADELNKGVFI